MRRKQRRRVACSKKRRVADDANQRIFALFIAPAPISYDDLGYKYRSRFGLCESRSCSYEFWSRSKRKSINVVLVQDNRRVHSFRRFELRPQLLRCRDQCKLDLQCAVAQPQFIVGLYARGMLIAEGSEQVPVE